MKIPRTQKTGSGMKTQTFSCQQKLGENQTDWLYLVEKKRFAMTKVFFNLFWFPWSLLDLLPLFKSSRVHILILFCYFSFFPLIWKNLFPNLDSCPDVFISIYFYITTENEQNLLSLNFLF